MIHREHGRAANPLLRALAGLVVLAAGIILIPAAAFAADTIPVYRLWNYYDGQHLITADTNEYRTLQRSGWQGEGEVFELPASGGQPVYRLLNASNGDHLYTTDANEYWALQGSGWTGEGQKFNGAPQGAGIPVYRLHNTAQTARGGLGSHLWTADGNEYASLPRTSSAWRQENVAWRAYPAPAQPANPSYIDCTRGEQMTLYGTVLREQWPTDRTEMAWSAVYYVLRLEHPITLTYVDMLGDDRTTSTVSNILLGWTEKYAYDVGWDRVNQGLDSMFVEDLQPYAGFRVSVTGSFGAKSAHMRYSPLFS